MLAALHNEVLINIKGRLFVLKVVAPLGATAPISVHGLCLTHAIAFLVKKFIKHVVSLAHL